MVEYGSVVSQGAGAAGGVGGGGSFDPFKVFGDIADRIAALPPEVLLVIVGAVVIGGLLVFRRV